MRIIEVTTSIAAPPEIVWQALIETDAYGKWNPFIAQLTGTFEVGSRLSVTIRPGNRKMTFRPIVVAAERNQTVQWLGRMGIPGIFDGRHEFHLEPLGARGTLFTQRESFGGILVGLLGGVLADTEAGFAAMNEALRARAEFAAKASGSLSRPTRP